MGRRALTMLGLAVAVLAQASGPPITAGTRSERLQEPSSGLLRSWQVVTPAFGPLRTQTLRYLDATADGSAWIVLPLRKIIRINALGHVTHDIEGLPSPSWSLRAISMVSPTDGWVVGTEGTFAHWDGVRWKEHRSFVHSKDRVDLEAITMVGPNDGWACMRNVPRDTPVPSTLMRWNGTLWYFYETHQMGCQAISMPSATDGWLLGSSGNLLHFDGIAWTEVRSPTTEGLRDIDMIDASDGWAVGGSTALHYDGLAWREAPVPGLAIALGVDFVSPTHGWVLTHKGTLRFDNGTWTSVPLPLDTREGEDDPYYTYDIEMLGVDDGWIVGTMGQVFRYGRGAGCYPITPKHLCPLLLPSLGGAL